MTDTCTRGKSIVEFGGQAWGAALVLLHSDCSNATEHHGAGSTLKYCNAWLSCHHMAMDQLQPCSSPLSTAPYQTEALLPRLTSPTTAALGATKLSGPKLGFLVTRFITALCL